MERATEQTKRKKMAVREGLFKGHKTPPHGTAYRWTRCGASNANAHLQFAKALSRFKSKPPKLSNRQFFANYPKHP